MHGGKVKARTRSMECPVRRTNSCGLVDVTLGFTQPMTEAECDACWALGGPSGAGAADLRLERFLTILGNIKKGIDRVSKPVAITVMGRHMEPDEARDTMLRMAPRFGSKVEEVAEQVGGPALVALVRERMQHLTDDEKLEAIGGAARWAAVEAEWREADEQVDSWSLGRKALHLFTALASYAFGWWCSRAEFEERHVSCHGKRPDGTQVQEPCPSIRYGKAGPYCGDCGCGPKKIARLDLKLWVRKLRCPRKRRGFYDKPATGDTARTPAEVQRV